MRWGGEGAAMKRRRTQRRTKRFCCVCAHLFFRHSLKTPGTPAAAETSPPRIRNRPFFLLVFENFVILPSSSPSDHYPFGRILDVWRCWRMWCSAGAEVWCTHTITHPRRPDRSLVRRTATVARVRAGRRSFFRPLSLQCQVF